MPDTWRQYSLEVLGYVAEMTTINERYVTLHMIQKWLDDGLTPDRIALRWNHPSGLAYGCKAGVNKYGVAYDSCDYVRKVLANLN